MDRLLESAPQPFKVSSDFFPCAERAHLVFLGKATTSIQPHPPFVGLGGKSTPRAPIQVQDNRANPGRRQLTGRRSHEQCKQSSTPCQPSSNAKGNERPLSLLGHNTTLNGVSFSYHEYSLTLLFLSLRTVDVVGT